MSAAPNATSASGGSAAQGGIVPPIISFGGLIGAGKDTVAGYLAEIASEQGIVYCWSKFATDLRAALQIITDIPAEQTTSDADKARPLPDRAYVMSDLKSRIGKAVQFATEKEPEEKTVAAIAFVLTGIEETAFFSEESSKLEVRILPMTIGKFLQVLGTNAFRKFVDEDVWVSSAIRRWKAGKCLPTLMPDDRFRNETAAVKAEGGVAVHIIKPGNSGKADGRDASHPSENQSAEFIGDFDFHIVNDGSLDDLRAKARALWPDICKLATMRAKGATDKK